MLELRVVSDGFHQKLHPSINRLFTEPSRCAIQKTVFLN